MSEVAKMLKDRRLNVWNEAKAVLEVAANENRTLTAEEQGKWEVLQEELDNLDRRMKSVLDTEKRARDADEAFNAIASKRPESGRTPQSQSDQELRSFLRGEAGAPRYFDVKPAGPVNYRTLSTTGASVGANLTPTDFYDQLIAHLIEVSGVMQAGPTVLNTAGGENLQIPKTTAHSTAASAAQASSLPTSDPAFGLATLSSYKYGILLQVARELIDDSGVDLIGYLAMQAGRAIGNKFGADLVTGSGTSQPTGFMTSATIGVTGGNTTTGTQGPTNPTVVGGPTYSALVDLEYSVIAPYRQSRSCYWIAKDATIGALRKILDSQNRPIWEPSMVLGSPDLLLGKPLVADPFMPAIGAGNQSMAFGDFSQFFVRMVGPVRFERSDDFLFGSDLVAFRAVLRGDGVLVDQTGAIKTFKGGAS